MFERLSDAPFGERITLETDVSKRMMPAPRRQARARTATLLGTVRAELGDIGADPAGLWDARLGLFGVRPADVGDMSPAQLLGCVDLFAAMYGGE